MPLLGYFLSAVLLFFANGAVFAGEPATPDLTRKVLLLNSYHPGYAWSDGVQVGILETLQGLNPNWMPRIEYLDCKRLPGEEHLGELAALVSRKYKDLALVIAMDNPALGFSLKNRKRLFEHTPILFCGINDFTPEMLHGHGDVTGRAENVDIGGTIDIMLRLHPNAREILILHDYTVTGLATRKEAEEAMFRLPPGVKVRFLKHLDMEDVLSELEHLPRDCLVLVVPFTTDKSGRSFGLAESTTLFVKHSPVPVYSAVAARLGHGIIGGKLTDAKVHGVRTARMALRILGGEKPSEIPVETESDSQFMFDFAAMARFGIPLSKLPENSIVINGPVSFYAGHRSIILLALSAIAVLCAVIALLTLHIVQRRRAVEALRISEERFRELAELLPQVVYEADAQGLLTYANRFAFQAFGYSEEDLKRGINVLQRLVSEDRARAESAIRAVLTGDPSGSGKEYRALRKDGTSFPAVIYSSAITQEGAIVGMRGILVDITEQKKSEEALRKSEETYRTLFENMTQGAFRQRADGTLVDVNPAALEMFGIPREEFLSRTSESTDWEVVHEDGMPAPGNEHPSMVALGSGKPVYGAIFGVRNDRTGELVWMEINAVPEFRPGADKPYQVLVTLHDITKRKHAEDELRRSEERFRYLIENAPDAIFVRTGDRFSYVNPAMLKILGVPSADHLIGKRVLDWIHPDGRAMAAERMNRIDSTSEPQPMMPQKYLRMDGTPVDVEASPVSLWYEGRKSALVFLRDITDRKRAEEEKEQLQARLVQAQKIKAIGTLAGGIAHDFNNILSVILGNTELAMAEVPHSSPGRYCLDQVTKAGYRARDLIGQILAFSRQTEQERKAIKVGGIAREVLKFLRASFPSTIEIRRKFHAERDTVLADPTQIHQVLMNLCTNAHHAMIEDGGILELELSNHQVDSENGAEYPDLQPGAYLKLGVSDTGCGMDTEVMTRIFEPYFTTKEKGMGTGLGLAVVHGIVKELGGAVRVQSESGKGSVFEVFLPLADEKVVSATGKNEPIAGGHGRILLVDDEEAVADLGRRMLQHLGYEVEVCTSSLDALETFKAGPERFDLVITDITMPTLTGDRLAKELIAIRRDIPIIICTGHSERISDEKAMEPGVEAIVMKPILMRDMAATIRRVLGMNSHCSPSIPQGER